MKIIRTMIVDDEPLARRGIKQLLAPHKDIAVAAEAGNGVGAHKCRVKIKKEKILAAAGGRAAKRSAVPTAVTQISFLRLEPDSISLGNASPALTCRAIFIRPCGTRALC